MIFGRKKKTLKRGGWVYVGESTRKNGSKKIYTGMTRRSPSARWGEHMDNVKKKDSRTWTGKGKYFRPIGAVWSTNPVKAEKTIKKMSPAKKKAIGRLGAKRYKKKVLGLGLSLLVDRAKERQRGFGWPFRVWIYSSLRGMSV